MRITLALVAVALAAAACLGSDPEPGPVPPTTTAPSTSAATTSPSPTASPTPAAPTLPAAARADTPAGAESFARFWLEALDYASRSGDTELLKTLGRCQTCVAQARGIDTFFSSGGRVEGGIISVTHSEVVRFVTSAALVNVVYDQTAGRTTSGSGKVQVIPAVSAAKFAFTLARSNSGWTVEKLQVIE